MNHVENTETQYQDLEYDIIYPIMSLHITLFLASKYNVDEKGEYECIVNYLTNEIKVLNICKECGYVEDMIAVHYEECSLLDNTFYR
tara:strand:+ start:122 stop:382 length:261 start_codon:yes stop_codon:yes gene_type:complete